MDTPAPPSDLHPARDPVGTFTATCSGPRAMPLMEVLDETCARLDNLMPSSGHWWQQLTLGPGDALRGVVAGQHLTVVQGPPEPTQDLLIALAVQAARAQVAVLIIDGAGCHLGWGQRILFVQGGGPELRDSIPRLTSTVAVEQALTSCQHLPISLYADRTLDPLQVYEEMWSWFLMQDRAPPPGRLIVLTGLPALHGTPDEWRRLRQWANCTNAAVVLAVEPTHPLPELPPATTLDWLRIHASAPRTGDATHFAVTCCRQRLCSPGPLAAWIHHGDTGRWSVDDTPAA